MEKGFRNGVTDVAAESESGDTEEGEKYKVPAAEHY